MPLNTLKTSHKAAGTPLLLSLAPRPLAFLRPYGPHCPQTIFEAFARSGYTGNVRVGRLRGGDRSR